MTLSVLVTGLLAALAALLWMARELRHLQQSAAATAQALRQGEARIAQLTAEVLGREQ